MHFLPFPALDLIHAGRVGMRKGDVDVIKGRFGINKGPVGIKPGDGGINVDMN